LPTDAKEMLSGLALASATSSATVFGANWLLATRICGSEATMPTGAKSFAVSKLSLL
jgi:hypothetical protein